MTEHRDLVLVTGASGFIAKRLTLDLLAAGYAVRGTLRSAAKGREVVAALEGRGLDLSRLELVDADLDRNEGWDEALAGVRFVHHTASPFPAAAPRDRLGLVATAKGGTLRVVEAAKRAGAERLVLTSSVAAVYYGHEGRGDTPFTEADISDVESPSLSSYAISKTLAERAAWNAVAGSNLQLVSINPALVLGPLLDVHAGTSVSVLRMMLRGRALLVPDVSLGIVDVRDVARAHVSAMTIPQAAGRRFLLSAGSLSLMEIGRVVAGALPRYRWRLPRAVLPDAVVRLAARVHPQAAAAVSELGRVKRLDTGPARALLGLEFHTAEEAITACAHDIKRLGLLSRGRTASSGGVAPLR